MNKFIGGLSLATLAAAAQAGDVKVHNVEYPSRLYGNGAVIVTVESSKSEVECVAFKGGVPVGSGRGLTTAGIANVTILISEKSGELTVRCS